MGLAPNGSSSLRYGLTGRGGVSALDTGRVLTGGGATYLSRALGQILSGATTHGGALLAPLGVRYVVAQRGDVPSDVTSILDAQADLDREGTTGLVIYRNAAALPPAGVIPTNDAVAGIVASADLGTVAQLSRSHASPLPAVSGGWAGTSPSAGMVVVSTAFSADWRLEVPNGTAVRPREAFGWSTSFDAPAGALHVRFVGQWVRTLEIVALGLLWLAALWITRKPVAR